MMIWECACQRTDKLEAENKKLKEEYSKLKKKNKILESILKQHEILIDAWKKQK